MTWPDHLDTDLPTALARLIHEADPARGWNWDELTV
jgi:hypothetical protein